MTIIKDIQNLNQYLPQQGQILALDIGTKRIGVAISDDTQTFSSPKTIITRHSNDSDFAKISKIINQYKISAIVIGLPLNMDGTESDMSKFVEKFAKNMQQYLAQELPIFLFDERLTSFAAQDINNSKLSKKQKYYDDIAASIILESFLKEKDN